MLMDNSIVNQQLDDWLADHLRDGDDYNNQHYVLHPSDQNFFVYRVFYHGDPDFIAYVGRTKQPVNHRIYQHLFDKPMVKHLDYNSISKIQFARMSSEADMNIYEIYYILKYKPIVNRDDKAVDQLTVQLPEVDWIDAPMPKWKAWGLKLDQLRKDKEKYEKIIGCF